MCLKAAQMAVCEDLTFLNLPPGCPGCVPSQLPTGCTLPTPRVSSLPTVVFNQHASTTQTSSLLAVFVCAFGKTVNFQSSTDVLDDFSMHPKRPNVQNFPKTHWQQTLQTGALPFTVLYTLIVKGVWAGSNSPPWRPSHTAATPLIFRGMPAG